MTPTERRAAFAHALAERVQPHVRGFRLAAEGEYIEVFEGETRWGGPWMGDPDEYEDLERLLARLEIALDSLQDDLAHMVNGAWPYQAREKGLPKAWICVGANAFRLGYGTLELEPIPLVTVGFPTGWGAT